MPLWTLSLRSLAGRGGIQTIPRLHSHHQQWLRARPPRRSYSTALHENRQDEVSTAPPTAPAESPIDSGHVISVSTGHIVPQKKEQPGIEALGQLVNRGSSTGRRRRRRIVRVQARSIQWHEQFTPRRRRAISKLSSYTPFRRSNHPQYVPRRRASAEYARRQPASAQPSNILHSQFLDAWWPIATIDVYYDKRRPIHYLRKRPVPVLACETIGWVERVMDHLDSGSPVISLRDLFPEWNGHERVWMQVALWFLTYDPPWMIRFLRATHIHPYPPARCVKESLTYLAHHYMHSDDLLEATSRIRELADLFCVLVDRTTKKRVSFIGPFIRHLIFHSTDEQIHKVFRAIKDHEVQVRWYTYLHFITYFAKHDAFGQALEALLEAKRAGAVVDTWEFRSNCSSLLRRAIEQPDGLRVSLRIVSSLADMGVILDKPLCDIIMLNAIEAGDLNTAFSVYDSLVTRGLEPTESTFAVLLKGCKMNIDDADLLNKTIRNAIGNINVRQSPLVATNILHCLALHHSKHHPETVYNTIADAYAQLFDVSPLERLRLCVQNSSPKPVTADKPMPPTPHVIGFMIGASLQQALARNVRPRELFPLYERWRRLVEAGDPHLATLATTDHLANIFLVAFIRHPSGLIHAARVVRDMQRSLPASAGEGIEQCAPTAQTWSIFLHGFTRHGKNQLAEQILAYMRSKGLEPNVVTWNTLAMGYARAQDFEGTADTLRRTRESGVEWDQRTWKGVSALRDRHRLEEDMARWVREREVDFTDELKSRLGKRLSRKERVGGADGEMGSNRAVGFGDSPSELAEQSTAQR